MKRLFIAALLPQDACLHLLNLQQALLDSAVSCRLTRPEQLHLTLRFIGEVGDQQTAEITAWFNKLNKLDAGVFPCHIAALDKFVHREGLTVYAALEVPESLIRFQNTIEQGLRALGVPAQTRPWVPHITLARKTRLRQTLSNLPAKKHPFYIKQLALIESQLKEEGPLYTPLIIAPAE